MTSSGASDTIVQEVSIKAPAERVFEALTDPAQRIKWWGAEGRFQTTHMESDLRPGGKWMMSGVGVGGRPFTVTGVYRTIDWQPDATESLVRLDLVEKDGVTLVRLTHSGLVTAASRESHRGWPQILGWLQAYVESHASA